MAAKKIRIPDSIDPAKTRLIALDGIATATEWERAAIVYAFTYVGNTREGKARKQRAEDRSTAIFTVTEFMRLGIKGLISDHTVKHYRDNWQAAIDAGEVTDILPGDAVALPDMDWPIEEGNQGSRVSANPATAVQQVIQKHGAAAVATHVAQAAPQAVAATVAQPAVAAATVNNPKAKKQVIQQQSRRTQRIIDQRKAAAAAAGPDVKGQTTAAVNATQAAMDNSPEYTAMVSHLKQAYAAWQNGIREKSFTPLDRHHMGADLPAYRRFLEENEAFVEAEDDPYMAVKQVRVEREDQFQREHDEAEGDTTLDDLDEIQRFANEGA